MKDDYKNFKILIVGDSCTDVYTYGYVGRLAPEGPVPIFNPTSSKKNGGMASNVEANIKAIGSISKLITQKETIIKTRYVDERTNTLMLRIDSNDNASSIPDFILNQIVNNQFEDIVYDAIVISDYCKGFLSEDNISTIAKNNKNVFLDTKKLLGKWCCDCSFIKINHEEYDRTKHLLHRLNLKEKLIITRSEKGCEYNEKIYPVEPVEIKDVSGAGDTFISGLVCEYIRTKNITEAIRFAQKCATIVVQKKGVCTI